MQDQPSDAAPACPDGAVAAFEIVRGIECVQPNPGDVVQVRLAGTIKLWRVEFMGAALGAMWLLPLEPGMPPGAVAEIRPVVGN